MPSFFIDTTKIILIVAMVIGSLTAFPKLGVIQFPMEKGLNQFLCCYIVMDLHNE